MSTYGGGYGLGSAYRIAPSIGRTRTFNLTQPVRYSPPGAPYTGVALPFSETWTGADGSVWPAEWAHNTIAGSTIQSNTGQITAGPGGGYDGALSRLAWIPNIVDTEVLVDVTAVSVGAEQYPQVALRTGPDSSVTRPSAGYSLFLCYAATPSSGFLQIERQPGGTILGTPAFALTGGVTYRVRFQAVGAVLSVKVWDASGAEPGAWTWTFTDTSPYLTAGSVTLGQGNGADGVARSARFDNLTVSTVGASEVHTTSGTGTATATASRTGASTRTKTATATAAATGTAATTTTRARTATATANASATAVTSSSRATARTATAAASAYAVTATVRAKTGVATLTAGASSLTTTWRTIEAAATAYATASGITGQGSGYRDITLTVGPGRSRTLTVAGASRGLTATGTGARSLTAAGASRQLVAAGSSRTLTARPRE